MKVRKTKFDYFEISTLDTDGAVNKAIVQGELWEPHIINFLKHNSNNTADLIDIGSNFGWHSLIASKFFKNIHSFEPQKTLCELQRESIKNSSIANISIYNVGLSNENKHAELNPVSYETQGYNTGDVSVGVGGENIELRTLDSYNFKHVDTIKLDVQGLEEKVLIGAKNTILENKPTLIVELENMHLTKFGVSSANIFNLLRSWNYYCFFLDYNYPADHVFVHYNHLKKFRDKNKKNIMPLETSNNLNYNYCNGVFEKLCYDR